MLHGRSGNLTIGFVGTFSHIHFILSCQAFLANIGLYHMVPCITGVAGGYKCIAFIIHRSRRRLHYVSPYN